MNVTIYNFSVNEQDVGAFVYTKVTLFDWVISVPSDPTNGPLYQVEPPRETFTLPFRLAKDDFGETLMYVLTFHQTEVPIPCFV